MSITLSIFFLETSTAASAQQSIIKSNLGKFFKNLLFEIFKLKFFIFFVFNNLRLYFDPFS